MVTIFKLCAMIVIGIGILLNLLALDLVSRLIKRYRLAEKSQYVERLVKKAKISTKKMTIASQQVKKLKGSIFRTSILQFLVPFSVFMLSVLISLFI
ncbi:MAG TPA: hypothetical protein ENG44_00665, partial [Desulfurococcaceae archaeon]|nr:hypothetical protein [Desulfurococcaceae archaeon]